MRLCDTIRIQADADLIENTVRRVFVKKIGKGKGYDAIGGDIRETAVAAARKVAGTLSSEQLLEIDEFVEERLGYIKNTFKELNAPMKDKSDERAALVGATEDHAARQFGEAKGWEWTGRSVLKQWVTMDPCQVCADNEDEGAIPTDAQFQSGDFAPPAHVNCVCVLEYVEDELEDEPDDFGDDELEDFEEEGEE